MAKRKPTGGNKSEQQPAETGRKKPARSGRSLTVWIDTPIAEALDRFIDAQKFKPTMTEVVELSLSNFLTDEGFPPKAQG